jgi:hypothetical protein
MAFVFVLGEDYPCLMPRSLNLLCVFLKIVGQVIYRDLVGLCNKKLVFLY